MIIPRPKSVRSKPGEFHLVAGLRVTVHRPPAERRLDAGLRGLLREKMVQPPAIATLTSQRNARPVIELGAPPPPVPAGEWSHHPEGYRLEVHSSGIRITGATASGAFYGLQTLAQLLRNQGSGVACSTITVEDWPSMAFRGAHWFPSAAGVRFHRKLIARIMAAFKLNAAVIQCEAARWDSHPEIAAPQSISKADLRGLVRLARQQFIDPIPLVNCPGHAGWVFRNHQHLDLAEDPQTPYALCPRNPAASTVLKDVLREALDVFKPHIFHLGHDEVTLRGRFPNPECPRCSTGTTTDLVLAHAAELHDWLGARGVRMMIWGDMLLAKDEGPDSAHAPNAADAVKRRSGLPHGTVVADWHYHPRKEYPSLALLRKSGLETIACTWHEPRNIADFAREARKAGARGLLQTTWAGYFPDESVLSGPELRQFTAFILAAEYSWSGRAELPDALGYDPARVFKRAYSQTPAR